MLQRIASKGVVTEARYAYGNVSYVTFKSVCLVAKHLRGLSWLPESKTGCVSIVCPPPLLQAVNGQQGTCKSTSAVPKNEITRLSGQGYQLVASRSATALMQVKAGHTALSLPIKRRPAQLVHPDISLDVCSTSACLPKRSFVNAKVVKLLMDAHQCACRLWRGSPSPLPLLPAVDLHGAEKSPSTGEDAWAHLTEMCALAKAAWARSPHGL